eukprot:scaffold363118_cov31-Prasinocladus_malaysianus.AAC.2
MDVPNQRQPVPLLSLPFDMSCGTTHARSLSVNAYVDIPGALMEADNRPVMLRKRAKRTAVSPVQPSQSLSST